MHIARKLVVSRLVGFDKIGSVQKIFRVMKISSVVS